MADSKADLLAHFAARAVVAATAVAVMTDTARFCMDCCGTYLTAQEYNVHGNLHGCKHTCQNRQECEAKLAQFKVEHPEGREI